jgi:two-component system cell cycle response regulator DivK
MNGRILVIEDNYDNMILITDMLESLDYFVLQAKDGQQGIEVASTEKPDAILMDLSLPVMDGWTATRWIKSNPDLRQTPVIALSAHAMVGDKERALAAGCDDYIPKPIDIATLTVKLTRLLA